MSDVTRAFIDRLLPAPVDGGFAMLDYWVWCGAVIRGEDGRYHMFAAIWPHELPFFEGYLTHSEIVRAAADTPEGPYTFEQVVLPARGPEFWDGQITHNPAIHRFDGTYLLFYIGATFPGPKPTAETLHSGDTSIPDACYPNLRIGLATADTIAGPWKRQDAPILEPRPGKWDSSVVTNPAPWVDQEGRILLLYRSNTPDGLRLGAAEAHDFQSPFRRLRDEPVLQLGGHRHVEDPFVWYNGAYYELLAKDMNGHICGEKHAGVHARSDNGLDWRLADPPKAYSRRIRWDDGTETVQGCLERPQLLIVDGTPSHLFVATGDGPGGFRNATRTWNMVLPLRSE